MKCIHRLIGRVFLVAAALLVSSTLSGCWTLSLHGIYSEDIIIDPESLDPGILGIWGDPDHIDEGTWQFLPGGGNSMRLIVREGHSSLIIDPARDGMFEAHLVRLGDQLILDLYPEEPESVNEMFLAHIIPAHSFFKVDLEGHVMSLSTLDDGWLQEGLERGELEIDHQETEDLLVLTAETAALQSLLAHHEDQIWAGDPQVMKRIQ